MPESNNTHGSEHFPQLSLLDVLKKETKPKIVNIKTRQRERYPAASECYGAPPPGPCAEGGVQKARGCLLATHTYLDGSGPFMSWACGPWGPLIARRPCPQGHLRFVWASAHAPSQYFPVLLRPSGWAGHFFGSFAVLTLTLVCSPGQWCTPNRFDTPSI